MTRPIPATTYVAIAVALLALTALTTALGRVPLGAWNLPIALGIAGVKAALVAVWFMHLRVADSLSRLAFAGGLLWLAILLAGTLDDYVTRAWWPIPGK